MPWTEVARVFSTYSWASIVLVFVLLPYIYFYLAIEVHRDFADLFKSVREGFQFDSVTLNNMENDLHIFNIDWWLVFSIAFLLVGLFSLDTLASQSESIRTGNPAITRDVLLRVKSLLVGYAVLVGLLLSFAVVWGRLRVARNMRSYYALSRICGPVLHRVGGGRNRPRSHFSLRRKD